MYCFFSCAVFIFPRKIWKLQCKVSVSNGAGILNQHKPQKVNATNPCVFVFLWFELVFANCALNFATLIHVNILRVS